MWESMMPLKAVNDLAASAVSVAGSGPFVQFSSLSDNLLRAKEKHELSTISAAVPATNVGSTVSYEQDDSTSVPWSYLPVERDLVALVVGKDGVTVKTLMGLVNMYTRGRGDPSTLEVETPPRGCAPVFRIRGSAWQRQLAKELMCLYIITRDPTRAWPDASVGTSPAAYELILSFPLNWSPPVITGSGNGSNAGAINLCTRLYSQHKQQSNEQLLQLRTSAASTLKHSLGGYALSESATTSSGGQAGFSIPENTSGSSTRPILGRREELDSAASSTMKPWSTSVDEYVNHRETVWSSLYVQVPPSEKDSNIVLSPHIVDPPNLNSNSFGLALPEHDTSGGAKGHFFFGDMSSAPDFNPWGSNSSTKSGNNLSASSSPLIGDWLKSGSASSSSAYGSSVGSVGSGFAGTRATASNSEISMFSQSAVGYGDCGRII